MTGLAKNPSFYHGGTCAWSTGSSRETIRPFQHIRCHLPLRLHRRNVHTTLEAFVDPDPTFIH